MGKSVTIKSVDFEEFFTAKGFLSADAFVRAKASEKETGQALATVLVNLGLISPDKLADGLASFLKLKKIPAQNFPEKRVDIPGLSPAFLKSHRVLPLAMNGKSVRVAMADPTDAQTIKALEFAFTKTIKPCVASLTDIEAAIQRMYFAGNGEGKKPAEANAGGTKTGDLERLQELAGDAPVIKFVEKTIGGAMDAKASDIHFEAMEDRFRLRFRVDGILAEKTAPPKTWQPAIISRIKIMASLNIAERRLPQDGRFKITVRGKEVDFRVSTIPSIFGESVVLRLLDRGKLPGDFTSLGFTDDATILLKKALAKPDGIVLVTGPTGSGKTTTLYSALRQLNTPDKKILTVEDPIEYMLDGVNQVQVNPKIGRTFASTLRSFLRQDPDIMLVGEIRDQETAEVAIQASLTGHLVLATLHTNNAAGALTRLLDMGVENFLIASTVSAVVGQRLVRNLCSECKIPEKLSPEKLKSLGVSNENATFYRPQGCRACGDTGYSGRSGVVEVLEVTDQIRSLIQKRTETSEIERAANKAGMVGMFQYGVQQAALGVTTLEEVYRVTRET